MQKELKATTETLIQLPRPYRLWLVSLSLFTVIVILCQPDQYRRSLRSSQGRLADAVLSPPDSEPIEPVSSEELPVFPPEDEGDSVGSSYEHLVAKGDSLEGILNQYGVELSDTARLARQHPSLRRLHIGQKLNWSLDEQGQLQLLQWQISQREVHHYQRVGNQFELQREQLAGVWRQQQVSGTIAGSFVISARKAGLTQQEIQEVTKALQWQFNFRKLRQGDKFDLLLSREYLNDRSAQSQVVAARFRLNSRDHYAVRADDGRFYDRDGNGLAKGFLRLPTLSRYPISSKFSPKRRHPITGRCVPHNGVDFAMPSGTPVLTVGDGEVLQAGYSGSAGYYVVIRHGRQYITRYFHLQKILVSRGQRVKCGEKIALSGNSGKSTGPHLHFEFHINQRPVDPLTARLPSAEGLSGGDRQLFLAKVNDILLQLPE